LPDPGSPTVSRRRLAAELRRLRLRAGLTGSSVAEAVGWSVSKLSRIETGRSGVSQEDVLRLLDAYHVSEGHRSEVLALARESATTPFADEAAIAPFAPGYTAYLSAEAEAVTIWDWEPQVVPGLLQTEAYAREVLRGWSSMFQLPPAELDRLVEARMARQHVLADDEPPDLTVVIDESVIHRRFGSSAIMRQQLDRLTEASEIPNVEIRVLALDGNHPIGTGSFSYMRFAEAHAVPQPDIVVVEQLFSNYYIDDVTATNQYRVTFEVLIGDALNPAQSCDLIAQTAREKWL
jgi:transcriptional regulator with XRE-family HTH domain